MNIISTFRNFLSHSTTPDYERMDKDIVADYQLPTYCTSWKTVRETIHYATMAVFEYLPEEYVSNYEHELLRKTFYYVGEGIKRNELMNVYGDKIQQFFIREKLQSLVNVIIEQTRKCLRISTILTHNHMMKEFEMSTHGEMIESTIESRLNRNGSQTFEVNLTDKTTQASSKYSEVELYFKISSADGNPLPKAYGKRYSDISKELWKTVSESITANIDFVSKVERNKWDLGSIIISAILYKFSADKDWTTEEITQIESCIPNICRYLENKRSEFKYQVKILTKPFEHDEIILSFQLVANNHTDADQLYAMVNLSLIHI